MNKGQLERRIVEYKESLRSMDTDRWLGEFAEDAAVEDPVGGPVIKGHEKLRAFFEQTRKVFKVLDLKVDFAVIIPPEAVVKWTTLGVTHSGLEITLQGIGMYKFREDGKLLEMRSFFDQKEVARQFMAPSTGQG